MQLSLPHCRPYWHGEPWHCPPSLGMTGCSPVPLTTGGSSDRCPKRHAEWQGLAVLYAAFSANRCLEALGSSKRIVIDGGFAANLPFARSSCHVAAIAERLGEPVPGRNGARRGAAVAEIFAHTSGFERGA